MDGCTPTERIRLQFQHIFSRKNRSRWKPYLPWVILGIQTCFIIVYFSNGNQMFQKCCGKSFKFWTYANDKTRVVSIFKQGKRSLEFVSSDIPENPKRVFYNRVPKCGSSVLMTIINQLQERHNFTYRSSADYMKFRMEENVQRMFILKFKRFSTPLVYDRHIHFIDFSQYGLEQPAYINVVREPLERLISWYYFRRYQKGHVRDMPTAKRVRTFDECVLGNFSECVDPRGDDPEEGYFKIIPFFCGQDPICKEPTDMALIKAIQNVKSYFAVVGYMEEYYKFLFALELILPSYFTGARREYTNFGSALTTHFSTKYKLPASEEAVKIMQQKMQLEYQFYYFITHRFDRLVRELEQATKSGH